MSLSHSHRLCSATAAARVRLGSKARPTASSSVASAHVKGRSCSDSARDVEPTIWDLGGDVIQREMEWQSGENVWYVCGAWEMLKGQCRQCFLARGREMDGE